MQPDSDDMMDAAIFFAIGTTAIAFLSVLLNLIFITCLNIAAENQVNTMTYYCFTRQIVRFH